MRFLVLTTSEKQPLPKPSHGMALWVCRKLGYRVPLINPLVPIFGQTRLDLQLHHVFDGLQALVVNKVRWQRRVPSASAPLWNAFEKGTALNHREFG